MSIKANSNTKRPGVAGATRKTSLWAKIGIELVYRGWGIELQKNSLAISLWTFTNFIHNYYRFIKFKKNQVVTYTLTLAWKWSLSFLVFEDFTPKVTISSKATVAFLWASDGKFESSFSAFFVDRILYMSTANRSPVSQGFRTIFFSYNKEIKCNGYLQVLQY